MTRDGSHIHATKTPLMHQGPGVVVPSQPKLDSGSNVSGSFHGHIFTSLARSYYQLLHLGSKQHFVHSHG